MKSFLMLLLLSLSTVVGLAQESLIVTRNDEIWISCKSRCAVSYEVINYQCYPVGQDVTTCDSEAPEGRQTVAQGTIILDADQLTYIVPSELGDTPFALTLKLKAEPLENVRRGVDILQYRVVTYPPQLEGK